MSQRQTQNRLLTETYGFDFPEDLLDFWEFVSSLTPDRPLLAFKALRGGESHPLGIRLAGPFDVLAAGEPSEAQPLSRFRVDPPEMVTFFTGPIDGLHGGYFVDEPAQGPRWTCRFFRSDFEFKVPGPTIWDAFRFELEYCWAGVLENQELYPEDADSCQRALDTLADVRTQLLEHATADRSESGEAYLEAHEQLRQRQAVTVAATAEGMGIVADPALYRPLSMPDDNLWEALSDPAQRELQLDALRREAAAALDAGYPASVLKLGRDLWATGDESHAVPLLRDAYEAMDRQPLRQTLDQHVSYWQLL